MDLSDQDIEEFAAIWQQEFGEKLTPSEAATQAGRLLRFYTSMIVAKTLKSGTNKKPGASQT